LGDLFLCLDNPFLTDFRQLGKAQRPEQPRHRYVFCPSPEVEGLTGIRADVEQRLCHLNGYTEEGMREAVTLLGRALAIDPFYAPAVALLGWCRAWQRLQGWGPLSETEVAEAVRLARQALEAGKDDPDTLALAANVVTYLAGGGRFARQEPLVGRPLVFCANKEMKSGQGEPGSWPAHRYSLVSSRLALPANAGLCACSDGRHR
jgi:hypothetical protein